MDWIKTERDEDCRNYGHSCFLCLQSIPKNIKCNKQINLTNLFLKYLKIRDEIEAIVCKKCGENLAKFVKLCNTLEKVRLEMDYLLDYLRCTILDSNNSKLASSEVAAVRKAVVKKCSNRMTRKVQIILERIQLPDLKTERSQTPTSDVSDEWLPNWGDNCNPNESDYDDGTPATPVKQMSNKKSRRGMKKRTKKKNKIVGEPLKCPKCSKILSNKRSLKIHNDVVHLLLKPFSCPTCFKAFASKRNLNLHTQAIHLRLKPFKCPTCSESFTSKRGLDLHINTVHLGIKPFKCDLCDKSYNWAASLRDHIATRHNPDNPDQKPPVEKEYLCAECGYKTDRYVNYKRHMEINHTLDESLKRPCEYCGKKFNSLYLIQRHIRESHGPKKFKCPECNFATARMDLLKRHVEYKHKGQQKREIISRVERPCAFCGKIFYTSSLLNRHIWEAHKPKRFKCQECDYATGRIDNIKRHVKVNHEGGQKKETEVKEENIQ